MKNHSLTMNFVFFFLIFRVRIFSNFRANKFFFNDLIKNRLPIFFYWMGYFRDKITWYSIVDCLVMETFYAWMGSWCWTYIYIFGNFISFFTYIISNTLFENLEGCVDIKTKDSVNINLLVKMIRRLWPMHPI